MCSPLSLNTFRATLGKFYSNNSRKSLSFHAVPCLSSKNLINVMFSVVCAVHLLSTITVRTSAPYRAKSLGPIDVVAA